MRLEFRSVMGKSRVKRSRPACEWAMPDSPCCVSLCECFRDYFAEDSLNMEILRCVSFFLITQSARL